jgi:hypothetical protein
MIYGETVAALLGYVGMVPELMLWFATIEDPAVKPAPLLGLLIPDDEDPAGSRGMTTIP